MANWGVLTRKQCKFGVIFGVLALQKLGQSVGGFRRKLHIPSTSLDASKKWFSIGIYSIHKGPDWL